MFRKKMYAFSSKDNDGGTLIYLVSARTQRGARKRIDTWNLDKDLKFINESRANFIVFKPKEGTEIIFPHRVVNVPATKE